MKLVNLFTNVYLLIVTVIVVSIVEFGFLAPALVSSQSNLGVNLGFASVIIVVFFYLFIAIILCKKLLRWFKEWFEEL